MTCFPGLRALTSNFSQWSPNQNSRVSPDLRAAASRIRPPLSKPLRLGQCFVDVIWRSFNAYLKIRLITHFLSLSVDCFFYLSHVRAFSVPLIFGEVLVD